MDSFRTRNSFCYASRHAVMSEEDSEEAFSGLLDIFVHSACDIHNICIYANQDVYAKFSLTCSPDEVISTRVIAGGGKNPQFDEELKIRITQADAVLKCEIWMLSRAKCYLEDQLLGFTLVPLSLVSAAKGKLTQDFSLSSTDLFHSPAGTVKLTLSFNASSCTDTAFVHESNLSSSISSEVVILEPIDYRSIEFPDVNVTKENQQMVSQYFSAEVAPKAVAPFLHLGASSHAIEDYDMTVNSSEENHGGCESNDGVSVQNSGLFSTSTTTSLSDERTSADSMEKKIQDHGNIASTDINQSSGTYPETPTSKSSRNTEAKLIVSQDDPKDQNVKQECAGSSVQIGSVFNLASINIDAEQSAMQQQIVDMYMKSMQQFTDSLAKMKLPMDLNNKPSLQDEGDVIQSQNTKLESKKTKKDGTRVFYGSRAFF